LLLLLLPRPLMPLPQVHQLQQLLWHLEILMQALLLC
jgi:hypothetical protein